MNKINKDYKTACERNQNHYKKEKEKNQRYDRELYKKL